MEMRTERIGVHGAFHGYWVDNARTVEPRFGTTDDVIRLQKELDMQGA